MKTFLLLLPCLAALVAGQISLRGQDRWGSGGDRLTHKQHQRVTHEQHGQHQKVSHVRDHTRPTHKQHQKVSHEQHQKVSRDHTRPTHKQHQKVTHEKHQKVSRDHTRDHTRPTHKQHQKVTHEQHQKVSHTRQHHQKRSTVAPLACDKDARTRGRMCYLGDVPAKLQTQYKNEFNAIDINHNGCINLKEFESTGVKISDVLANELKQRFQRFRQNGSWKQFGGGKRRLASTGGSADTDFWKYLQNQGFAKPTKTKRQKDAENDTIDSKRAARVFKKFDSDHSDQITECEYAEAMYKQKRREDKINRNKKNNDIVVVHG